MKKYLCVPCGYIYDPTIGDPDGGIAPGTAFEDTSKHTSKLIAQLFVLPKKIANLTGAHANIAGGHISVRTDMAK